MKTGADGKLASLPAAVRDQYTFGGWYTLAEGGEPITTSYIFTEDTTVYAHWTAVPPGPTPTPTPSSGNTVPIIAAVCAALAVLAAVGIMIVLKRRS